MPKQVRDQNGHKPAGSGKAVQSAKPAAKSSKSSEGSKGSFKHDREKAGRKGG